MLLFPDFDHPTEPNLECSKWNEFNMLFGGFQSFLTRKNHCTGHVIRNFSEKLAKEQLSIPQGYLESHINTHVVRFTISPSKMSFTFEVSQIEGFVSVTTNHEKIRNKRDVDVEHT